MHSLRQRVIETFEEYGGWWRVEGMAEWLGTYEKPVSIDKIRKIYDELEAEGLMDRKKG